MNKRGDRILIAIAALLVVGLALFWRPDLPARRLPEAALADGGDFTLQSADGPVALESLRGKLVLLYFGYTYCPDVCPTSLSAISEGLRQLEPEEQARVATIFVSVDPRRDTLPHLKEYVAFFHPSIIGVSGTPEAVADVARRYGVFYAEQKVATAGDGYVVDHSTNTYIIAADGKLVGKIAHAMPPEQVAAVIRKYLSPP